MKKSIKILIMVAFVFILSGCEANYNLNIIDNEFREEIIGISYDSSTWNKEDEFGDSLLDQFQSAYNINDPALYDSEIPSESNDKVEGVSYYEKDFINDSNSLKLTAKYNFKREEFSGSLSMMTLFPSFSMKDRSGVVEIDSGKIFYGFYYYPFLDNIKVTITTNHVVNDHNASEIKGNSYIWYLTRDAVDDNDTMKATINFSYLKNETTDSKGNSNMLIIIIILAILSIVAIIFARGRIRANNS